MGHARALITASDPSLLAQEVVRRGLSVRDTEKLAKSGRTPSERFAPRPLDADTAALERQLSELLGVGVTVKHGGSGGSLTLAYSTLDQLDMLCQRLTGGSI